ncbi:MAG: hypothetical protein R3C71_11620 [Candidatus Krumholzibacteriia bacterium]|nr:hypothetical protein [bacterium]MCB9514359.1 hypothetical protein [Candidatus Latescibacterota bacterium]MCB9516629.1 hypothetical protein [Candidatus Latescibacterota bacterium]
MATDDLLKELLGQGQKKQIDPLQYLRIIWRKKHLLLIPLAVSWVIAAVGVNFIPPTFVAGSSVAIESDTNFTRDLSMLLDEQASHRQEVSELAKVRAEVRAQDFLDEVINTLSLDQTPLLREKAQNLVDGPLAGADIEEVVRRLAAEELRDRTEVRFGAAGVYNITTQSHDPTNAYLINSVMVQKYVEMRRARELAEITAKGDFSDEQVAIFKEKLHRAELELERFQETQQQTLAAGNPVNAGNVAVAQEVMSSYAQELSNIEGQVDQTRSQLRSLFGVVPTSDRLLSDRDLRALNNKQIHTMVQNLIQYLGINQRRDQSLTEVVEDASVGADRQAYRDRLGVLTGQIYAGNSPRERELIVSYYYRLMLVGTFQELVDTLSRHINNFRQNVSGAPAFQAELDRRKAEAAKYREFLEAFQQQSTSAQITRAIQASQLATRIDIRDHAVKPIAPVKPNKPRLQMVFVGIGLVTGLALIFMTEFFNRAFSDVKDVEALLGLPVLGTIPPLAQGPGKARVQRRKNTLVWVIAMGLFAVLMAGGMVFVKDMNSRIELYVDRVAAEELVP